MKNTTDTILAWIKEAVESGKAKDTLNPQKWMDAGLALQSLISDETDLLERLKFKVAEKKWGIISKQEDRNVTAAEMEVRASQEYLEMKIQEHKVAQIKELVMLCKKNADVNRI